MNDSTFAERLRLIRTHAEFEALLEEAGEVLMSAWGLIANAYEGDWDSAPPMWHAAALRYRDMEFHPFLDKLLTPHPAAALLVELRDWFFNETRAGDQDVIVWVDKINAVIGDPA